MNYDVVICGGGPAGIAAAIVLSKAGVSTALIEKCTYPREKTCAGILTSKTLDFLKDKFSLNEISQVFSSPQVSIMYKGNTASTFTVQYPFAFIERHIFDSMLLELCQKDNISIMERTTIKQLFPSYNQLLLSNNQSLTFKCLVIADGVFSPTCKHLGLSPLLKAFCIQDKMKREICPAPLKHLQELQLYIGDIQLGYSWIVPYPKDIAIGTGMFINQTDYSDLIAEHELFCQKIHVPCSTQRRGAFVPIGGAVDQNMYPYENIVVVGDAAGLVNPLTGEGIYHAILSGYYAGQSFLQNPQKVKQTYLSFLQPVTEELSEQKRLLTKMYDPFLLENVYYQFMNYPKYWGMTFDEVISSENRSYKSLFMELQQLLR